MGVQHIRTSIDGLLEQSNSFLSKLFDMDGNDARKQILELKSKGHKYLPSENCKNFDPFEKGCFCDEVKTISIVRVSEQKTKIIE